VAEQRAQLGDLAAELSDEAEDAGSDKVVCNGPSRPTISQHTIASTIYSHSDRLYCDLWQPPTKLCQLTIKNTAPLPCK